LERGCGECVFGAVGSRGETEGGAKALLLTQIKKESPCPILESRGEKSS